MDAQILHHSPVAMLDSRHFRHLQMQSVGVQRTNSRLNRFRGDDDPDRISNEHECMHTRSWAGFRDCSDGLCVSEVLPGRGSPTPAFVRKMPIFLVAAGGLFPIGSDSHEVNPAACRRRHRRLFATAIAIALSFQIPPSA